MYNSRSKADHDFCDSVKLFNQNANDQNADIGHCLLVARWRRCKNIGINNKSCGRKGIRKTKRVDSARAVLLLLKRDLGSSVQAEGRLVRQKRKKMEGLEKLGVVGYRFAVVLIHPKIRF